MRKSLLPLAVAAVLGMAGAALANESTGTVQSIDMAKHMVTLSDGTEYVFSDSKEDINALESFKTGDHVKITWVESEGGEGSMPRSASMINGEPS